MKGKGPKSLEKQFKIIIMLFGLMSSPFQVQCFSFTSTKITIDNATLVDGGDGFNPGNNEGFNPGNNEGFNPGNNEGFNPGRENLHSDNQFLPYEKILNSKKVEKTPQFCHKT